MRRDGRDVLIVAALAAVGLVLTWLPWNSGLLRLLAAPLILGLPGYAVLLACAPRSLGRTERMLISCALSMALVILGGFVLHITPWGLRPESWAFWLGGITLLACGVAWLRRSKLVLAEPAKLASMSIGQISRMVIAGLLVVAAIAIARWGSAAQPQTAFTQLWLRPRTSTALEIGVRSYEAAPMAFRLEVRQANRVLAEWQTNPIAPGQEWTAEADLPASAASEAVEAVLYRLDSPQAPYRTVNVWPAGNKE